MPERPTRGVACADQHELPLRERLVKPRSAETLLAGLRECDTREDLAIAREVTPHVADVLRRVDAAVGDDATELWPVKLTALVHEVSPAEILPLLDRAGFGDVAPVVRAIVTGFGELWRVADEAGLDEYVARHRPHLRSLLLFEVAHEGRATDAMRAAASLGGLARDLAGWLESLREMQR